MFLTTAIFFKEKRTYYRLLSLLFKWYTSFLLVKSYDAICVLNTCTLDHPGSVSHLFSRARQYGATCTDLEINF
jgi:hypothetical protein